MSRERGTGAGGEEQRLVFTCPECNKRFRVPHAKRTWSCKSCGGDLEFVSTEDSSREEAGCSECGTEIPAGAAFCEQCGHALSGTPEQASRAETKVAGAEMRRAMKKFRTLRAFLWLSLMLGCLQLVLIIAGVLAGGSGGSEGWLTAVILGLVGGFCLMNLAAIHQLDKRPFPAILALALLRTLFAALELMGGGISPLGLIFTIWLWTLVIAAAKFSRLAREHPELYLARRMRGELTSAAAGLSTERSIAQRSQRRSRERDRKSLYGLVAGGALVVIVMLAGFWGIKGAEAPDNPQGTLEAFQAAWNRADTPALAEFARDERISSWPQKFETLQHRYEWGEALPPLDRVEVSRHGEQKLEARFYGTGGMLAVKFKWSDDRWCFTALDMRNVKTWRP